MNDGPSAMDVQSYAIAASWAYFVALDIRLATDTTIDRNTRISAEVGNVGWAILQDA